MADEWVLSSRRVVLPDGLRPASIHVRDNTIVGISGYPAQSADDAGDLVVMPGLVDTHVHINEPGRTHWEGFETATRAAAAGGITTLIEMPLNSIPATTSVPSYQARVAAAANKCWVDVGFWGGVVPGNTHEIERMLKAGCFGFKCFLTPSGVDEFAHVDERDLRAAMPQIARTSAVLLAHAELPAYLLPASGDPRNYRNYRDSRPPASENFAIELLLHLSQETGARIHIVHLSSAEALPALRSARSHGLRVSVETCPHYLTFAAEEIADGATEFKCAPPIRDASNREALWAALRDGTIDMIVSDHSPCPPEMKRKDTSDFFAAWGGIASLQIGLPAVWTEASRRGFTIEEVTRWMCSNPAKLAGLNRRKGEIAPGRDADLIVWDPEEEFTVEPAALHHRHKLTPYAGRRLRGVVKKTYLRGKPIDFAKSPHGVILRQAWN
jgi:allantoinase